METTYRQTWLQRVRGFLPQGLSLPPHVWERRHRTVLAVVFLHAPFLAALGIWQGWGYGYAFGEPFAIVVLGLLAAWRTPGTRFRSTIAAFAAVTCSSVLVQFTGGYIEAHFHFFIMVSLIALYQDWLPFLLAVAYVAFDHGVIGQLAPTWVYNHPAAIENPWQWAAIHAVLVLGQCAALLVFWRGLERERARSEVILDTAGEGILGLNHDGTVQFANPASSTILGRRHEDLLGKPFLRLAGAAEDAWPPTRAVNETVLQRPDGRATPVMWAAKPSPPTDSGVAWVVSLHDLTERKAQERERLQQLLEQDRFKTQLLNTASHELNTPISVLRLQLDLLKRELDGSSVPPPRSLEVLERNVGRLGTLVQQTLDVARIQSGKLRLEPSEVAVGQVAVDTCRSFEHAAAAKGVSLTWEVEPELTVEADATRISQVFYNLVANAVKFTPPGGAIHLTARRKGDAAEVMVADTGSGISEADLQVLFRPFSQGVANPAAGGTGLGLYISKSIVESHGGRITAASDGQGKGATFTCRIPLRMAPQHKPDVAGAQAGAAAVAPRVSAIKSAS